MGRKERGRFFRIGRQRIFPKFLFPFKHNFPMYTPAATSENLVNHRAVRRDRSRILLFEINACEMDSFEIRAELTSTFLGDRNTEKERKKREREGGGVRALDRVENLIEVSPRSILGGKFVAIHPIG